MTVDLNLAALHVRPPKTPYRVVTRERAWLRRLRVRDGDQPVDGPPLALLATEANEPLDATSSRPARLAIAATMHRSVWGWR
jgi:hypothetical protein